MPTLSTHVIDASGGGARPHVEVRVTDEGGALVTSAYTDDEGRIGALATGLTAGPYRITWVTRGAFVAEVAVTVELADERHYHVPLLVSPVSAVAYLGV
jgi:5-hydroxyisourate hydrolase